MNAMSGALVFPLRHLSRYRLFQRIAWPASPSQIIRWWEFRRIPFNVCVGVAGLVSSAMCLISGVIAEKYLGQPIGIPDPPLFAVFAALFYGILANVCYTGGWIAELLAVQVWKDKAKGFAEIAFTLGMVFALLLTLVPGFIFVIIVAYKLITK